MKIVFMGTPDLAAEVLETMMKNGCEVTLAVTQPDRPRGRGRGVIKTPVHECADRWGIPVFSPVKVKVPEAVQRLREEAPDLIVVAAFGQILSKEILELPRYGCVNVHASLLPKYRGAAPIQWAVINGEEKSGVTIMQMDAGIDTGDILLQEETELAPDETAETLSERLSRMGAALIVKAADKLQAGTLTHTPQEGESCYAGMLKKEMGLIDWKLPAEELDRRIRGLKPWPGTFTFRAGKKLIIGSAEVLKQDVPPNLIPGAVFRADKTGLTVQCGEDALRILTLQPEGKKMMDARSFLNGSHVQEGEVWG